MIVDCQWVLCPVFKNKTGLKIRGDTEVKNLLCIVQNVGKKI